MAYDHNIPWVPHGWNTAIGLAAELHLSAAMPVARYVEYLTPCAYLDEIITEPFRRDAEGVSDVTGEAGAGPLVTGPDVRPPLPSSSGYKRATRLLSMARRQ